MKKILLLIITLTVVELSFAQLSWGVKVGQTFYDLQSNSSVANRLVRNVDGSMSVVWIDHFDFLIAPDNDPRSIRGFGYNHFDPTVGWMYGYNKPGDYDGECWGNNNGCGSAYLGWPEIINIPGATGDKEMVFSHFRGQNTPGMSMTSRSTIGTGSWNNTITLSIDTVVDVANNNIEDYGGTWPRAVASGNYIHMISCFAGPNGNTPIVDDVGVENPIRYYRSSDAGQTWDLTNVVLPFDSSDVIRIGGDAYAMYANGNTVAITLGAGIDSDWLMLKSIDNGLTWTKTRILDNHDTTITSFQGTNGSRGVVTNDDAFSIVIDNNGVVHCFAAMAMTDDQGFIYRDPQLFFQTGAGILYWKEGMNTVDTVAFPDYGYDGNSSNYDTKVPGQFYRYGNYFQSYPTASFDANGNIYLIYSSITEGTEFIFNGDTSGFNDLNMVFSLDNGDTWCRTNDPINIAEDIYEKPGATPTEDDVFPSAIAEIGSDNTLHFIWQGDYNRPGLALVDDSHPNDQENYIQYANMDISGLNTCADVPVKGLNTATIGIQENIKKKINFSIVPNPAREIATISADAGITSVSLVNIYGQVVKTEMVNSLTTYTLNVANMSEGIYIVKVETTEGIATQKLNIIK